MKDGSAFNPSTHLNKGSTIPGQYATAWWAPRAQQKGKNLVEVVEELGLDNKYYVGGCVRVTINPSASKTAGFKKPTALDGIFFPEWLPAPDNKVWGVTSGGSLEAIAPKIAFSEITEKQYLSGNLPDRLTIPVSLGTLVSKAYRDTRRYAEVSKMEKGLVDFEFQKVTRTDTHVVRWVIEEEGKAWRLIDSEHTLFKPVILDVVYNDDGTRTITYKYEDDNLPMEFTVTQKLSDYSTSSIKGTNLRCTEFGRGVTEEVDTHRRNEGRNNSHLIANWFSGSGYRESLNLITTSAEFNQVTMRNIENKIADAVDSTAGAKSFDLTVNVKWDEFLDEQATVETEKDIKHRVQQQVLEGQRATIDDRISKFVAENRRRIERPAKRCLEVDYLVEIKDASGKVLRTMSLLTGPDKWISKTGGH